MRDTRPGVEMRGYSRMSLRAGCGVLTYLLRSQKPFGWMPATIAVNSQDCPPLTAARRGGVGRGRGWAGSVVWRGDEQVRESLLSR